MIDFTKLNQGIKPHDSPPGDTTPWQPTIHPGEPSSPSPNQPSGYDWSRPDWLPGGTYNWWGKNPDPGFGTPNQQWFRHPSWGDDAVYNQYWGYQNVRDIANLYGSADGTVTNTPFKQWDLTQQLDPDWSQYGFTRAGDPGGGSPPGGGGPPGGMLGPPTQHGTDGLPDDIPWNWQGNYPPMGGGAEATQFPYPEEWDIASNVLGNFATHGYPTDIPEQWGQASDFTNQMMQTGMPVHQSDWYQQAKGVAQTDITDAIKQAAEQARLGGLRWSTPLGRTAQDIAGRRMSQFGLESMDRELASGEAARSRQMGSLPYMYQFGAGEAGLAESAKQRGLGAAQQLMPLGQMRSDLPQQLAQTAYGMGTGLYGQQQQGLGNLMQEWMRTQPENSPWMQYAMSIAGLPMPNMQAQQYNPSSLTSLLGGLGGMLPFLFM